MDSHPRRKILTLSIVLLISCIYVHKRFFYSEQKNILAYASKRTLITHRCRSLFTIDESVIQALLYQASNNTNENNYSSTRKGGEGHYHEVSTDKYTLLASFLPVALKMKKVNLSTGGYLEKENAEELPILLRQRRIDNAGAFPLANCAIASYSDMWQYSSCIKKWIELAGSLRIYFMGDSKVRYLFNEFLQQTNEEYNYTIKVADRNGSFELFQTVKERAKTIQEAITDKDPNFRIKFRCGIYIN
ncbi:hypothetical protein SK128_027717 [Halocaridina rubra]|uniref:Uncharacterized protein n=1 Tax=Halocaridina rubra TaxID=373956 RepID=A0AAN8ZTX9_HALRR